MNYTYRGTIGLNYFLMHGAKRINSIAGILFAVVSCLTAQENSYDDAWRWSHFTTESGLPSNSIYFLMETEDSTLWALSDSGVAWYDGFQWIKMKAPEFQMPGATLTSLSGAQKDDFILSCKGENYIGNRTAITRCASFNIQHGNYLSGDTSLLIRNNAIYYYKKGILQPYDDSRKKISGKVDDLFRVPGGGVWISTPDGLYEWEAGEWSRRITTGCPRVIDLLRRQEDQLRS